MLKFWIVVITFRNAATFVVGNKIFTDINDAKTCYHYCDKQAAHFELPDEAKTFGPITYIELVECFSNKTVLSK